MSREIIEIPQGLPMSQLVDEINSRMAQIEGIAKRETHWTKEVDQIESGLGLSAYYKTNIELGHNGNDYTSWDVLSSQDGYDIWRYPIGGYVADDNNQLRIDTGLIDYMGSASSLSQTTFDKVFILSGGVYTDHTTEAASSKGTPIAMLGSNSEYLLLGSSTIVSGVTFRIYRPGGRHTLDFDYSVSAGWGSGSTGFNGNSIIKEDGTQNWLMDGEVLFNVPGDFVPSAVNGSSYYWYRAKTTTNPTIKAQTYQITPNSNVIDLVLLNQDQLAQGTRRWTDFNGEIFVTIKNAGKTYYEGNSYIRSGSSATLKQTYFTVNHLIEIDYKSSDYAPIEPYRSIYTFADGAATPNNKYMDVSNGVVGNIGHTMPRPGYITGIGISAGVAPVGAAVTCVVEKNRVGTVMSGSLGIGFTSAYLTSANKADPTGSLTISAGDTIQVLIPTTAATAFTDVVVDIEISHSRVGE